MMMRRFPSVPALLALFAVFALLAAACSGSDSDDAERARAAPAAADDGDSADHDEASDHDEATSSDDARTVEVAMTEFAFDPGTIEVSAGEPVRFLFHNEGAIEHEAMLGDAHMQEEFRGGHDGQGNGHHGDVHAVTVQPGESAELTVTFEEAQTVYFGCHLPGHYEAGMEATVEVS